MNLQSNISRLCSKVVETFFTRSKMERSCKEFDDEDATEDVGTFCKEMIFKLWQKHEVEIHFFKM